MQRNYSAFTITDKAEKAIKGGHPWVYGEEVTSFSGSYYQGDIVDVFSKKGSWLGSGFVNDSSKIRVRLISRNANDKFDFDFWARRVKYAIDYRLHVCDSIATCRLIFGESDGFPGLTVDKYEDLLVTQVLCLGLERVKDSIYKAIVLQLNDYGYKIKGILERCDVPVREKEGLAQYKAFYHGDWMNDLCGGFLNDEADALVRIEENGLFYDIDCFNGQKTGYFLDQKLNRVAAGRISKGLRVLDCFCNQGGFSLNCAKQGALEVTGVDISELATATATRVAKLNGLEGRINYITEDVFELLTRLASGKTHPYDMIILDPPAFTKSRETAKNAYKGYKDINYRAMRILPRGGYLVSCSCSHFMDEKMFESMLLEAALDANVSLKLIEKRLAGPDHPVTFGIPETEYLKFYIMQVV